VRQGAGSVEEIIELYERYGGDSYDEDVTQLAHGLQTAALAQEAGADDALVIAALLHDAGHLLHVRDGGRPAQADLDHEGRGSAWLRPLLPASVAQPIALHVRAKRYLCAAEPGYMDGLSSGSLRSLELQGGAMSAVESEAFAALPGFDRAVQLRRWDDAAKVTGLEVDGLEAYRRALAGLSTD
jgi:phosphonate degradation associated HDIG domain protein